MTRQGGSRMTFLRSLSVCLTLGFLFASPATLLSADNELSSLEGNWSLSSMTKHGGKVSIAQKLLGQTKVSIDDNELRMNKYWQLLPRNYNPKTKTAEGYLDGHPGHRYSIVLHPEENPKQIDLQITGILPQSEEDELSPAERDLLRNNQVRHAGIYSLDGDKLTICFDEYSVNHKASRPTNFSGKESEDHVLMVLKRKPE
ncbi:TIGR03067 domain-containing protein [Gimesia panareensis]|nr:TIGR03067 domain-containing protein [Gimesia panareensis]